MLLEFKSAPADRFVLPEFTNPLHTIYTDPTQDLTIRNMTLAEVVAARQQLLIPEGWPGIKYTLGASYATDPNGFYLLEKGNIPIGSISVVTYPGLQHAFIGFFAIEKDLRGNGLGTLLLQKTMEYTKQHRGITSFGLNCVPNAIAYYAQHGFTEKVVDEFWKYTATENVQYTSSAASNAGFSPQDLAALIEFDTNVLGSNREPYLQNFLFKPQTITVIDQQNGAIQGYGVMSEREPAIPEPNKSYKIGPLYAQDSASAQTILQQLLSHVQPHETAFLDVSSNNAAAISLQKLGLQKFFAQAKMYTGDLPATKAAQIYGYSSIAIGG